MFLGVKRAVLGGKKGGFWRVKMGVFGGKKGCWGGGLGGGVKRAVWGGKRGVFEGAKRGVFWGVKRGGFEGKRVFCIYFPPYYRGRNTPLLPRPYKCVLPRVVVVLGH